MFHLQDKLTESLSPSMKLAHFHSSDTQMRQREMNNVLSVINRTVFVPLGFEHSGQRK